MSPAAFGALTLRCVRLVSPEAPGRRKMIPTGAPYSHGRSLWTVVCAFLTPSLPSVIIFMHMRKAHSSFRVQLNYSMSRAFVNGFGQNFQSAVLDAACLFRYNKNIESTFLFYNREEFPVKILKVKCLAPTRLDNYLTQQFPALTPGRLNKALRENKIKLNGKKQPLSTRVMAGDEIKLFILDEVLDADRRVEGPAWKNARGLAQVVYDCPQIIIVNKPAGLAVDGPEDDTLLNRTLLYLNQQGEYKENDLYTPALCHRLDTGTSGLVIVAKTPEAEELFLAAIKNREVKKTYLCVTFGRPTPPDATLGGYLLKDADRGIVKIVEDKQPGARDVETRYETIAVSGRLALLKVQLITGRTHQIRAHMASIGCPILGDSKYGNNTANRELKLKYQALCAWELTMPHFNQPDFAFLSGKTFHAPKPWYYNQVLDGTLK